MPLPTVPNKEVLKEAINQKAIKTPLMVSSQAWRTDAARGYNNSNSAI
ncbi:MAG: hypothetical protein WC028_28100 [Candidatus Obscuribacterales bacterium]|jgi:hypothetical protein